ncbi:MAG: DNA cytosine methyltransferase [Deltaproteobacteria bacterium]|nr:DNA cytosine methyltransferase [Deltaproteobacteria bacterium]
MKNEKKSKPIVIDLFAGAGGMTEGLKKAGFRSLLANEYDEMAAHTFSVNHPKVPIVVKDVKELSVNELLEKANLKKGELSLIAGGPPCQGFSLAGPRLDSDPRNKMFKEFVRLVEGVNPEVFLFENVSGIMNMSGGAVLKAIINEFTSIGYKCEFQLINAADYGLPQARPRFILIGVRDGELTGFPDPTHANYFANSDLFNINLKPYVTVWDALSDLPTIQQGEGEEELKHSGKYLNDYQLERRGSRNPSIIFNHRATRHSDKIIERYALIPEGGDNSQVPEELRTKKINVFKLHSDRPSRTVTCNHRTDLLHPRIPRGITVREAARLQSFDDDYQFFGNLTRKAKWVTQDDQVGNAVPPLLALALGKHLIKARKW